MLTIFPCEICQSKLDDFNMSIESTQLSVTVEQIHHPNRLNPSNYLGFIDVGQ
jgi:hypothetical protein